MSNNPIFARINHELTARKQTGLFRATPGYSPGAGMVDCTTNSYLGLHANTRLAEEAALLAKEYPCGNLASRLVYESSPLCRMLEQEIAEWEHTEEALVFGSGYAANIGILQALCTRTTEVFSDRLNHASIYDGIRLAGCRLTRYHHCDMNDLETRLQTSTAKEKIIITDTVFSMDGDRAPLAAITAHAESYGALVIVDEAHATGLFGTRGSGLAEATGTEEGIAVRMGTLSKAIGGLGGYAAVSETLRDYFVNFSRSLIYSTGLPPAVLAYNLAAVRHVKAHPEYGKELQTAAAQFRSTLSAAGFTTAPSTTQIIPCYTKNPKEATALRDHLRTLGIRVPAIRPPTVPEGTSRLRFSWSRLISGNDADRIVTHLTDWSATHG